MAEDGLDPAFAAEDLGAVLDVEAGVGDFGEDELAFAGQEQGVAVGGDEAGAFVDVGVFPESGAGAEVEQAEIVSTTDLVVKDEQFVCAHR